MIIVSYYYHQYVLLLSEGNVNYQRHLSNPRKSQEGERMDIMSPKGLTYSSNYLIAGHTRSLTVLSPTLALLVAVDSLFIVSSLFFH